MPIYVIKVTTNKEERALEMIEDKVKKKSLPVYSLARPRGLRGYIFLEAEEREVAEEAAFNLPYVKGIIGKTVTYEEIKNMLEPKIEEIKIPFFISYVIWYIIFIMMLPIKKLFRWLEMHVGCAASFASPAS